MSAIRSNSGEGATPPSTSTVDSIYRFLSSVRFAILVLSFIAASCVLGTLIKQQAPPQEYLKQFSESTYAILKFLRLTDVFRAPWFLILVSLFVVNLVLCTLDRFGRFLKTRKDTKIPSEKAVSAMANRFVVRNRGADEVVSLFNGYRTSAGDDRVRLLEKGSLSRYGVYVIHSSIIIILIGSLIGIMFGYRGFVTLNKGETKDTIVIRGEAGKAVPLGFKVKCDDFKVSFYPTGEPKDYVSRLQIIDDGKSVRQAEVRVNHPLTYRGTSIYQASYGSDPAFLFDIGGQEVRLAQGGVYKKDNVTFMVVRFERSVHNFGPGVMVAYIEGNEPKTTWFLKNVPQMRERQVMGAAVKLTEISDDFYTGLEVSHDPGVWVVWTGFALILFGLYINFFMYHRRIYVVRTDDGILVAGASLRNKEAFREEFEKWRKKINGSE
jgi:cytochrome c biogenesis protein